MSQQTYDLSGSSITIDESVYQWEWNDYGWTDYDSSSNEKLERAYKLNPKGSLNLTISGVEYKIDFNSMQQENMKTGSSKRVRRNCIHNNNYKVSITDLQKLFEQHRIVDDEEEEEEEGLNIQMIMNFCKSLGLDPEKDITVLVMFYKLGCKKRYYISKEEFIVGFAKLNVETLAKIKKKLPQIKNELMESEEDFKRFYFWLFNYSKDQDQKRLEKSTAIGLWKLVFPGKFVFLNDWCEFIETTYQYSIAYDTWQQLLMFSRDKSFQTAEGFKNYDASASCYPTSLDEFIEYEKKKLL